MSRGSYNVENGKNSSTGDTSYRSCLCAMLIFMALCLIIVLATIKWSNKGTKPKEEFEKIGDNAEHKNEQIQMATTERITTPTTVTTTTSKRITTLRTKIPEVITNGVETRTEIIEDIKYGKTTVTSNLVNKTTTTTTTTTTERTKDILPKTTRIEKEIDSTTHDYDVIGTSTNKVINLPKEVTKLNNGPSLKTVTNDNENSTEEDFPTTETLWHNKNEKSRNKTTKQIIDVINSTIIIKNPSTEDDLFESDLTTTETIVPTRDQSHLTNDTLIKKPIKMVQSRRNRTDIKQIESTTYSTNYDNDFENLTTVAEDLIKNQLNASISDVKTNVTKESTSSTEKSTTIPKEFIKVTEKGVNVTKHDVNVTKDDVTIENTTVRENMLRSVMDDNIRENKRENIKKTTSTTTTTERYLIKKDVTPIKEPPVCKRDGCVIESTRILSHMNHSASVCDNFYEFACGGTQFDYDPDEDHHYEKLIKLINKINKNDADYFRKYKNFYDSCMSYTEEFNYEERIDNIKVILNNTGDIYLQDSDNDIDLTGLFAKLLLAGSLPIFDIDNVIDKQTSKIMLRMSISDQNSNVLNVPDWKSFWRGQTRCLNKQIDKINSSPIDLNRIHDDYVECQKDFSIYVKSIANVCKELGYFDDLPNPFNVSQREEYLKTSVEWDLLQLVQEMPNQYEIHKTLHEMDYFMMRVSDLNKHFKLIDWKRFFHIITDLNIDDNMMVQIYFHTQFVKLFTKLNDVKKDVLNDVLLGVYANDLYQYMITQYFDKDRSIYCVKLTSNLFKDITAKIYSETYTNDNQRYFKALINDIFVKIKNLFKESLTNEPWISDDDKVHFLSKLKQLRLNFYNNVNIYLINDFLIDKYKNLNVSLNNFQKNLIDVLTEQRRWYYGFVRKSFTDDMLFAYYLMPYDQEPVTYYSSNVIGVPMGLMKFHYNDLPIDYLHVKIGIHLARAIGKHFDDVGLVYKMQSTDEITTIYKDMMKKMSEIDGDTFSISKKLGNHLISYKANENFAISEKISDNTAFNMTMDSIQLANISELLPWISMSYTSEQLRFIGLTQEFCKKSNILKFMIDLYDLDQMPSMLKVDNIIKNSYSFNAAFNCSITDSNPKFQFPHLELGEMGDYGDIST